MEEEVKLTKKGTIVKILDMQQGESAKGPWAKVQFVLNTGGEFAKDICFTVMGVDKVDKFLQWNEEGDTVEVSFDVSSREYKGKYYTDINAWMVKKITADEVASVVLEEEEDDDLPFD